MKTFLHLLVSKMHLKYNDTCCNSIFSDEIHWCFIQLSSCYKFYLMMAKKGQNMQEEVIRNNNVIKLTTSAICYTYICNAKPSEKISLSWNGIYKKAHSETNGVHQLRKAENRALQNGYNCLSLYGPLKWPRLVNCVRTETNQELTLSDPKTTVLTFNFSI